MKDRRVSLPALVLVALFVGAVSARAQQVVDLSQTSQPVGSAFQWVGPQAGALAGTVLYRADMNGDVNRLDLVVGAPGSGPAAQGQAFVEFIGPPHTGDVSLSTVDVVATGEASGDKFGSALAAGFITTPDVQGARYQDLVVGAPAAHGGNGAVYLFPAPMTEGAALSASSAGLTVIGRSGDQLGAAIVVADIDGDGYRDIVMAAPGSGTVYVVFGGSSLSGTIDLGTNPGGVMAMGGTPGTMTLAAADFNGDGRNDVAVGYPGWSSNTGAVFFVLGKPRAAYPSSSPAAPFALMADADGSVAGIAPGDQAGAALTTADFDWDHVQDLIVGAPGASPGGRSGAGSAYVLWGGSSFATPRLLSAADVTIVGPSAGAHLGTALASGQIRRNLQTDLVMLAPGASAAGDVDVVYGAPRSSTPSTIDLATGANRIIRGDPAGAPLASVVVVDDTGEGADDVLAGAPTATALGNANAGIVYNVYSPTIWPSPGTTSASVAQGATQTVTVDITNIGSTTIHWAVRSDSPWLTISPTSGTSSADNPGVVTLTIAPGNLAANQTYNGGFVVVSTDNDLLWNTSAAVNLAVTPGSPTSTTTTPSNPTGTPVSTDEGSPNGVYTPVGSNITVTPVAGVEVTFANVSASGQTSVAVMKETETGSTRDFWGAWDYRISTTATIGGPVTIGVAYDPSLVASGRGTIRIVNNGLPMPTVHIYPSANFVVAMASGLPVTVNVENTFLNDFDSDGRGDLIWRRASDGALGAWFMNGSTLTGSTMLNPPGVPDTDWTVVGTGDFNGDGSPDLLWRNAVTGTFGVWFMNGTSLTSTAMLNPSGLANNDWQVVGVADFDLDGQPDLLWWNQVTGELCVWFMNGVNLRSISVLTPGAVPDVTWKVAGVGDFNHDGYPDILWRSSVTGQFGVWLMNGVNQLSAAMLNPPTIGDLNWQIVGVVDIDGDGNPDIVWQNMATNAIGAWLMDGINLRTPIMLGPGVIAPGWKVVAVR